MTKATMEQHTITYNTLEFINADFLKSSNPAYFINCNETIRNIINDKHIKSTQYLYATFNKKNNKWTVNDTTPTPSCKAKLFISKIFSEQFILNKTNNNININNDNNDFFDIKNDNLNVNIINYNGHEFVNAEFLKIQNPEYFTNCKTSIRHIIADKKLTDELYIFATFNNKLKKWSFNNDNPSLRAKLFIKKSFSDVNIIIAKKEIFNEQFDEVPPILQLTLDEKFKDDDDNIIDITVRGYRQRDKCFFLVDDISDKFDIINLKDNILANVSSYDINIDYKFFVNNHNNKIFKELYLTYDGIIKLVFISKSKKAHRFRNWVIDNLFTMHLGTKEHKEDLAHKLLGVSTKHIKNTLKLQSGNVSCIYLFTLGLVSDLRSSLNISTDFPNHFIVGKFGRSDDLLRRNGEHENDFGKFNGVNLRLKVYSCIDAKFLSQAENDIKSFVSSHNLKFNFDNRNELIILSPDTLDLLKNEFDKIRKIYAGDFNELIHNIEILTNNNILLQNEIKYVKLLHEKEIEFNKFKVNMYEQILQGKFKL